MSPDGCPVHASDDGRTASPVATPVSQPPAAVALSIVVPVWNGADRLPRTLHRLREYVAGWPGGAELVLVDDHSAAETVAVLQAFHAATERVTLLRNEQNRGKGYSVARGMLVARGRFVAFTDADLAYSPADITTAVRALEDGADIAIACRVLPESRYLVSPTFFQYFYTRHVASRAFNCVVRALVLPDIFDTQAGLKAFTREAARRIFPRLTVDGFGFDIECLYIAHAAGLRVRQVPVVFRYDDEPTSVRFLQDGTRLLRDLVRIRWNGWRGRYA